MKLHYNKQKFRYTIFIYIDLIIVLALYQVSRWYFYIRNHEYIKDLSCKVFLGGIRFDLSTVAYSNIWYIFLMFIPFYLFSKKKQQYKVNIKCYFYIIHGIFISINSIGIITNIIDVEYSRFTGRRSSWNMLLAKGMEKEVFQLLDNFILDFKLTVFVGIILIYILLKSNAIYYKLNTRISEYTKHHQNNNIFIKNVCFILSLGVIIIFARGGLQNKPLQVIDATQYSNPSSLLLAQNSAFNLIKSIGKKQFNLKHHIYFSKDEVDSIYNPIQNLNGEFTHTQKIKVQANKNQKNIVIILLESFGKENISYHSKDASTPFLDSLIQKSVYFKNAFANGKRSIIAVPSVLSGIPNLMERNYIQSDYANNQTDNLIGILKKQGYHTAFFHGAFNGSQNFNSFSNILGIDQYFGQNEYEDSESYHPENKDKHWGIFDKPFLSYSIDQINTFKKPFLSTIFTLSSHHPYTIPDKYKGKFPKTQKNIGESISYTDHALSHFFSKAKKQDWYYNTIFIITADHTSSEGKGKFNNLLGKFAIPLLWFEPSSKENPYIHQSLVQHIDIPMMLLESINYQDDIINYGKGLNQKQKRYNILYYQGVFHCFDLNYHLSFDGKHSISFKKWNNKDFSEIVFKKPYTIEIAKKHKEMIEYLKAYIQSYMMNVDQNTMSISSRNTRNKMFQ